MALDVANRLRHFCRERPMDCPPVRLIRRISAPSARDRIESTIVSIGRSRYAVKFARFSNSTAARCYCLVVPGSNSTPTGIQFPSCSPARPEVISRSVPFRR
jgi:hypothetical protein